MKSALFLVMGSFALAVAWNATALSREPQDKLLTPELRARNRADMNALKTSISKARARASQDKTYKNYLHLALLEEWMCEAANDHRDDDAVKEAAENGVSAAKMAVSLNPNSSDAHWLLGDLLGQLIPHVFAGGMRYGARSTSEIERAIALDPKNANAYVSRATSYYFTPTMFGGDKRKAVDMLQKAIQLNPSSDAADTAHIWLAEIYKQQGKHQDALREVSAALKLEPDRRFAANVYRTIIGH